MFICCLIYFVSKVIFWQADSFGDFLLERVLLSVVMAGMLIASATYALVIKDNYRMAGLLTVISYGLAALLNECHQTITVFLNQLKYAQCGMSPQMIGYVYIGVMLIGMVGGNCNRVTSDCICTFWPITVISPESYGAVRV